MFQQTKWRLTLLNTIVVALILSLLSLTLYFFMKNEISHRIDRELTNQLELETSNFKPMRPKEFDSRTVIIYYLSDGRVATKPKIELTDEFLNKTNPTKVNDKFATRWIDGYQYRLAMVKGSGTIEYVQVVRNIHSEYEQLYVLKRVLIIGSIFGCLVAFGIGYFLAKYSLIPIQRSWNQQKRFVGDASHELRTPIAVIQSGAEQLLQDPEKSVLYHSENVNRMLKETRRMNRLISDLLLLAKTDSDQVVIEKQRVNIYEIVEEVTDYFEDVAMLKNILFNIVCQDEVYANVDKEKIQQLLINLLDNAMKYTNEEGSVVLKVSIVGQKVLISVKDSGIGIANEHHKKLFDRFYRVDKARTRDEERSHGLGLSIVKWIVDSHDGDIEVKSELGKGTEFIVTLPVK